MKSKKDTLLSVVCAVISIGTFILIWQMATNGTTLGQFISGPWVVLKSLIAGTIGKVGQHSIAVHAVYSLGRVLIGYILGSAVGILLGLLMGWYPVIRAIFWPIYSIIRPIPSIAWIPISIIWFGLGEDAKIFIVFISSFANLTLNAYSGAKNTDMELIGAARMLGAKQSQLFFTIVLPSSVPQIFAGLQVAMSSAWATVMAAEMVRSSEGLGWMIVTGMNNNNIDQILTGIVAIGIIGFILAVLMRKAEEVLCRWNRSSV